VSISQPYSVQYLTGYGKYAINARILPIDPHSGGYNYGLAQRILSGDLAKHLNNLCGDYSFSMNIGEGKKVSKEVSVRFDVESLDNKLITDKIEQAQQIFSDFLAEVEKFHDFVTFWAPAPDEVKKSTGSP